MPVQLAQAVIEIASVYEYANTLFVFHKIYCK